MWKILFFIWNYLEQKLVELFVENTPIKSDIAELEYNLKLYISEEKETREITIREISKIVESLVRIDKNLGDDWIWKRILSKFRRLAWYDSKEIVDNNKQQQNFNRFCKPRRM